MVNLVNLRKCVWPIRVNCQCEDITTISRCSCISITSKCHCDSRAIRRQCRCRWTIHRKRVCTFGCHCTWAIIAVINSDLTIHDMRARFINNWCGLCHDWLNVIPCDIHIQCGCVCITITINKCVSEAVCPCLVRCACVSVWPISGNFERSKITNDCCCTNSRNCKCWPIKFNLWDKWPIIIKANIIICDNITCGCVICCTKSGNIINCNWTIITNANNNAIHAHITICICSDITKIQENTVIWICCIWVIYLIKQSKTICSICINC